MPQLPQYNGLTYGYNPYYQTYLPQPYMQPQTAQSPVQQVQTQASQSLVGHIVTANDQIPVSEVPQNGAPAYFPMQDGSSILAKSWQPDGTIATVRYIPEVQQSQPQEPSQPDEQLNHLKTDVETMWKDATPEQRKRIKESLTKWSTTLTV